MIRCEVKASVFINDILNNLLQFKGSSCYLTPFVFYFAADDTNLSYNM